MKILVTTFFAVFVLNVSFGQSPTDNLNIGLIEMRCARILDQKTPESTHDSQQTKKAIHTRVQGPSH
jgi:hypothetical protein